MNSGPQRPIATSAVEVAIRPWSVSTARTRPPSVSIPVARVEPMNVAPRRLGALAQGLADVAALGDAVARDPERAEHALAVEQREAAARLVAADHVASSPHAVAYACRRCSSASRSGVVATSSEPTSHHVRRSGVSSSR